MVTKNTHKEILVYANWHDLKEPTLMGILTATLSRGKEIFSFEYTKEWLSSGNVQYIDPNLQLYSGPQYLDDRKSNFGIFLDSSPDRWGRMLMRRREAALARNEGRKENTLFETDYLLGVFDDHRMGGIRFKVKQDGPFLDDNMTMASPPWTMMLPLFATGS
jgi:serine/threonine-protein kinase HipA